MRFDIFQVMVKEIPPTSVLTPFQKFTVLFYLPIQYHLAVSAHSKVFIYLPRYTSEQWRYSNFFF